MIPLLFGYLFTSFSTGIYLNHDVLRLLDKKDQIQNVLQLKKKNREVKKKK